MAVHSTNSETCLKILVFTAHNILTPEESPHGYHLLQLIRSYIELDMYASLVMHSVDTIAAGEQELLNYHRLLEVSVL